MIKLGAISISLGVSLNKKYLKSFPEYEVCDKKSNYSL